MDQSTLFRMNIPFVSSSTVFALWFRKKQTTILSNVGLIQVQVDGGERQR